MSKWHKIDKQRKYSKCFYIRIYNINNNLFTQMHYKWVFQILVGRSYFWLVPEERGLNSTSRSIPWTNLIGILHIPLTNQNGYCIWQVPEKIIYEWNVNSCKHGVSSVKGNTSLGGQVLTVNCYTGSYNVFKTVSGWQLLHSHRALWCLY